MLFLLDLFYGLCYHKYVYRLFKKGERRVKDLSKVLTYIIYVGQLGLDLIVPVLMCLLGAWYLNTHFGWGMWIYFVGFVLGLGASGMTFWKFYTRVVMKGLKRSDHEKDNEKKPKRISFSKHI